VGSVSVFSSPGGDDLPSSRAREGRLQSVATWSRAESVFSPKSTLDVAAPRVHGRADPPSWTGTALNDRSATSTRLDAPTRPYSPDASRQNPRASRSPSSHLRCWWFVVAAGVGPLPAVVSRQVTRVASTTLRHRGRAALVRRSHRVLDREGIRSPGFRPARRTLPRRAGRRAPPTAAPDLGGARHPDQRRASSNDGQSPGQAP
jgi:hypothetical protein